MSDEKEIQPQGEANTNLVLAGHLCGFAVLIAQSWIAPLVVFLLILLNKDISTTTKEQLRIAFNFHLSQFLIHIVMIAAAIPSAILVFPIFILMPLVFAHMIFWVVSCCLAAYRFNNNQPHQYMLTANFMK